MAESELDLMLRVAALADYGRPLAVSAAASLGIAELFEKARTAESAALQCGLNPGALRRLLRALVASGLFSEPQPGTFELTAASRFLLQAHPYSLRAAYSLLPADVRAWGHAEYSLQTGQGAFEYTHGRSLWQYLAEHPDASAQFDRSMDDLTRLETIWLLEAYDWPRFGSLVDVGGGTGAMLFALLRSCPALRGVLFDTPQVIARAVSLVGTTGLGERCELQGGDFFASIPAGYDAYVLKRIIYSYDDLDAVRILKVVRAGMRRDSRILILEPVNWKRGGFDYGKLLDMQMLILGGGGVRDRHALRGILESASLRLRRTIPTPMAAIVEALPE